VPFIYDDASGFSEGYAWVVKDGKYGILHNTAYGKPADTTPQLPFSDVAADAWYFDAVKYVYGHGLMNGTSDDKFSPDSTLTRGMIVTILYRYYGEPDTATLQNPFSDVPAEQWYSQAVLWAADSGIVTGYGNGRFGPNDAVTREQLAAIIHRLEQSTKQIPPDILMDRQYPDFNDISAYAKSAVTALTMQGIFRDIPGDNFKPQANALRAEVAAMLRRFLEAVE
jgi:hypothetical protein